MPLWQAVYSIQSKQLPTGAARAGGFPWPHRGHSNLEYGWAVRDASDRMPSPIKRQSFSLHPEWSVAAGSMSVAEHKPR